MYIPQGTCTYCLCISSVYIGICVLDFCVYRYLCTGHLWVGAKCVHSVSVTRVSHGIHIGAV